MQSKESFEKKKNLHVKIAKRTVEGDHTFDYDNEGLNEREGLVRPQQSMLLVNQNEHRGYYEDEMKLDLNVNVDLNAMIEEYDKNRSDEIDFRIFDDVVNVNDRKKCDLISFKDHFYYQKQYDTIDNTFIDGEPE